MDTITAISLIAAYAAGIVALFAPCCISYLLPTYLANVFKERSRILWMTVVYSFGIFIVMMPVILGAKALSNFFFSIHDTTYIVGGSFLILVAFLSLIGFKLPIPHLTLPGSTKPSDTGSTFILGIFSGITTACCAPVLFGVMALSSLSPSVGIALIVGAMYVLGMVTPLYIASLIIHKRNILTQPWLKRKITVLEFKRQKYPIFITNLISFFIFLLTGFLLIILTLTGKVGMPEKNSPATKMITDTALLITEWTNTIPLLNTLFFILVMLFLWKFWHIMRREATHDKVKKQTCCQTSRKNSTNLPKQVK